MKKEPPIFQAKSNHFQLYILVNGPNATQRYQIKQKQFLIPHGFQPFERHKKNPKPSIHINNVYGVAKLNMKV